MPKKRKELGKQIGSVLDKTMVPIDFSKLDGKRKKSYLDMARTIVDSETFQSETAMLVAMWTRQIAVNAGSYEEVRDLRMCIVAIEFLASRLRSIAAVGREPEAAEDPFEAI